MKRFLASLLLVGSLLALSAGTALADNWAGNSGHFHPQSPPCHAAPDQPHCPGPH